MPIVTTLSGETVAVDLSTRDFEGYRSDILDPGGLADLYTPDWSDRSAFDLGVALTEVFCFIADNLSYYQDRMANEALFPSAVQRRSIIEHCKLLGYELRAAVSSVVSLTIVTTGPGIIPKGTGIQVDSSDSSTPTRFELAEDQIFIGAETRTDVYAYEGTSYIEVVGSSLGTVSQSFTLKRKPLALNPDGTSSLVLTVRIPGPIDVVWAQVDNFLSSSSTDEHFVVSIDEFDIVTILFGDGVNGAIPPSGIDNIRATYRVGNGRLGNEIGPNRLTKLVGTFSFVSSITNPSAPNGGRNKESIEEAKINAPRSLRAFDRCVTHEDYAAKAMSVPGVRVAFAYRGTGVYEERVVIASSGISPIPTGEWDPLTETGSGLLYSVGTYLTQRKTTPVILYLDPVRVAEVSLSMVVYCEATARVSTVKRSIEEAITDLFSSDNQLLGTQFPLSKVYECVEGVRGVSYLDITQMQRYPNVKQTLGPDNDVEFSDFVVNSRTIQEQYTILFTNSSSFDVLGYSLGYQGSGTLGTPFLNSRGTFGFTADYTLSPPTNTTRFISKTSDYVSNINPDFDELVTLRNSRFQLVLQGGVL